MLKFLDGPACDQKVRLEVRRAPIYLRVTFDCEGTWDALDQLHDAPRPSEQVYAYILVGRSGWVHYDGRDKNGKRFGRTVMTGDYRLCDSQPDDDTIRDNALWQAWCTEQHRLRGQESANV